MAATTVVMRAAQKGSQKAVHSAANWAARMDFHWVDCWVHTMVALRECPLVVSWVTLKAVLKVATKARSTADSKADLMASSLVDLTGFLKAVHWDAKTAGWWVEWKVLSTAVTKGSNLVVPMAALTGDQMADGKDLQTAV